MPEFRMPDFNIQPMPPIDISTGLRFLQQQEENTLKEVNSFLSAKARADQVVLARDTLAVRGDELAQDKVEFAEEKRQFDQTLQIKTRDSMTRAMNADTARHIAMSRGEERKHEMALARSEEAIASRTALASLVKSATGVVGDISDVMVAGISLGRQLIESRASLEGKIVTAGATRASAAATIEQARATENAAAARAEAYTDVAALNLESRKLDAGAKTKIAEALTTQAELGSKADIASAEAQITVAKTQAEAARTEAMASMVGSGQRMISTLVNGYLELTGQKIRTEANRIADRRLTVLETENKKEQLEDEAVAAFLDILQKTINTSTAEDVVNALANAELNLDQRAMLIGELPEERLRRILSWTEDGDNGADITVQEQLYSEVIKREKRSIETFDDDLDNLTNDFQSSTWKVVPEGLRDEPYKIRVSAVIEQLKGKLAADIEALGEAASGSPFVSKSEPELREVQDKYALSAQEITARIETVEGFERVLSGEPAGVPLDTKFGWELAESILSTASVGSIDEQLEAYSLVFSSLNQGSETRRTAEVDRLMSQVTHGDQGDRKANFQKVYNALQQSGDLSRLAAADLDMFVEEGVVSPEIAAGYNTPAKLTSGNVSRYSSEMGHVANSIEIFAENGKVITQLEYPLQFAANARAKARLERIIHQNPTKTSQHHIGLLMQEYAFVPGKWEKADADFSKSVRMDRFVRVEGSPSLHKALENWDANQNPEAFVDHFKKHQEDTIGLFEFAFEDHHYHDVSFLLDEEAPGSYFVFPPGSMAALEVKFTP